MILKQSRWNIWNQQVTDFIWIWIVQTGMLSTLSLVCPRPLNCESRKISERVTITSKLTHNTLRHTTVLTFSKRRNKCTKNVWFQRGCHQPHWLPYQPRLKPGPSSLKLDEVGVVTAWFPWGTSEPGAVEESDSVYLFSSCKVEIPIIYIYLTGYILSYVGRMQHSCNGVFQPETHGHLDGELKKCFSKQIQNHELSPSVMKMKIYFKKKAQDEICTWKLLLLYHIFLSLKCAFFFFEVSIF